MQQGGAAQQAIDAGNPDCPHRRGARVRHITFMPGAAAKPPMNALTPPSGTLADDHLPAKDRRGGLWMVGVHGFFPSITWSLYHFAHDRWTRRAIPAKTGARASVSALAWIPRTRSLWAIGEQVAGGLGTGDILKYGP